MISYSMVEKAYDSGLIELLDGSEYKVHANYGLEYTACHDMGGNVSDDLAESIKNELEHDEIIQGLYDAFNAHLIDGMLDEYSILECAIRSYGIISETESAFCKVNAKETNNLSKGELQLYAYERYKNDFILNHGTFWDVSNAIAAEMENIIKEYNYDRELIEGNMQLISEMALMNLENENKLFPDFLSFINNVYNDYNKMAELLPDDVLLRYNAILEKQKRSELKEVACNALDLGIVKSQNLDGDTLDVVIGSTVLECMPESFLNSYDDNGVLSDTDKDTRINLISERLYDEWVSGDKNNICVNIEASIKKAEKNKDMALKYIQNDSCGRK